MLPLMSCICNDMFASGTFKLVFGDAILYSVVFGN